ncbi:MAG: type II toxin-antitoxin system Phd/YefM family antitoxin [bacterium]
MATVNVHEAKTRLSQLIEAAESGEEVVIARAGRPVVRLVALGRHGPMRKLGRLAGKLSIPEDFDAPMPDEWLAQFEGRN